jgi:hypothetical protein
VRKPRFVAQICNLLYRRILFGTAPAWFEGCGISGARQIENLRYSRLKICATRLPGLVALAVSALLGVNLAAQQSVTNDSAVRFRAVDIYVDSKESPLAAYQIEFSVTNGNARIVGIEGGEHPAFTEPPFYDPKAMQHERVIVAAFSTNPVSNLPKGKTRLATIHIQTRRAVGPEFELKLQAAADSNGKKIPAEASAQERNAK